MSVACHVSYQQQIDLGRGYRRTSCRLSQCKHNVSTHVLCELGGVVFMPNAHRLHKSAIRCAKCLRSGNKRASRICDFLSDSSIGATLLARDWSLTPGSRREVLTRHNIRPRLAQSSRKGLPLFDTKNVHNELQCLRFVCRKRSKELFSTFQLGFNNFTENAQQNRGPFLTLTKINEDFLKWDQEPKLAPRRQMQPNKIRSVIFTFFFVGLGSGRSSTKIFSKISGALSASLSRSTSGLPFTSTRTLLSTSTSAPLSTSTSALLSAPDAKWQK